jgi:serine/threonine protein kinase
MAPEQAAAGEVDHRADLYAVGALLFELLTGQMIFERQRIDELLAAVMMAEAPAPSAHCELPRSVRAAIDRVVARCLAKDPEARPQSARELLRELRLIAARLDHGRDGGGRDDDRHQDQADGALARATSERRRARRALPDTYRLRSRPHSASKAASRSWALALFVAAATWLAPHVPLSEMRPALLAARHSFGEGVGDRAGGAIGARWLRVVGEP